MDGGARQPRGQSGRAGRAKITINVEAYNGTGHTPVKMRASSAKPRFLPFKKALLCARSLKLKNEREWRVWCKSEARHPKIPRCPDAVYKHDGWEGYGHWLGTGNLHTKEFLPFKKALLCARSLKLKNRNEWSVWCKSEARRPNIPCCPDEVYKHDGWEGYGHWLGTGNLNKKEFLPFKQALLYAHSLKLKSQTAWRVLCKSGARPANIPSTPDLVYKHDDWQGYGHWLGTGNLNKKQFLPFKQAMLHARSLRLKARSEWEQWSKSGARPANIPSTPAQVYKHAGWQGWGHWLGTGNLNKKEFLPFKQALLYAHSLKLKGEKAWRVWSKSGARPANIPSAPDQVYKHDGWQGYGHWLDTGNLHTKQFLPFKKALMYARSLKLNGVREWEQWSKGDPRPANVPSTPNQTYKHEGWLGYGHWLSSE